MKKALKILGITLLTILVIGIVYINFSLPKLPEGTEKIIDKVIQEELKELKGEEGFAQNGATQIWYESITPKDSTKGVVMLIMGISNDALAWPDYFIDPFVDNGYQVIRFDNRGTGMSDWLEDWEEEKAYDLEDMAKDAIAVLDHLNIPKAHLLGVSLGGMIAQTLSINAPERVVTLTSMMSTGYMMDETLPSINMNVIKNLILSRLKYGLIKSEASQIKLQIMARELLKGEKAYEVDVEGVAQSVLYNLRKRKGFNPNAFKQQSAATINSGSRYEALSILKTPTLVIHGTSDPLISFEHGEKCNELIPNSDHLWIEGMGHAIPEIFVPEILEGVLNHIEKNSALN